MEKNNCFVAYIGFFKYDKTIVNSKKYLNFYSKNTFYEKNQHYLQQKYYANWLQNVFTPNNQKGNTYQLKDEIAETISISGGQVKNVEVILFPENYGVFVIKTKHTGVFDWDDFTSVVNENRKVFSKQTNDDSIITRVIEQYITNVFSSSIVDWRTCNSQLKVVTLIDIADIHETKNMDEYLFALGTHTSPNNLGDIYQPSSKYYKENIEAHSICVFNNWKALCLYDSLSRISIDLDKYDSYHLWENEYLYIYINVLFTRFFLQNINDNLADLMSDSKRLLKHRDIFFNLTSSYNHSKISYKFLPNILNDEYKKSMEIEQELECVKDKIERLNSLNQEKREKRIQGILTILTLFSIFSIANESSIWLSNENKLSTSFIVSSLILIVFVVVVAITFFRKK